MPRLDLPTEIAWLNDPEIWKPLPQQEGWDDLCHFWEADPDAIQFPPLEWEPCGEGCARAELLQGHGTNAGQAELGTSADGTPRLRVVQAGIYGPYHLYVNRYLNLASGRTEAAVLYIMKPVEDRAWCGSGQGDGVGSVLANFSFRARAKLPALDINGGWDLEARRFIWQLPWFTWDEAGFSPGYCKNLFMEAGARRFHLCTFVVRAALTPGSSETIILDRPGDAGYRLGQGSTLGDQIIWAEIDLSQRGSRVRGWAPDGQGVRTLLDDIAVDTCAVGLSPTHVAGFSTAGACDYYQPEGRFWIARRQSDGTLADFRLGPVFWPEPVAEASNLAIWGNHLAIVWFDLPESGLQRALLVRTTDWAMRELRGFDRNEVRAVTVTDEHLYVTFFNAAVFAQHPYVYRYDLDAFDHIGDPVLPPPASAP